MTVGDKFGIHRGPCGYVHQLYIAILADHHDSVVHTVYDRLQEFLLYLQLAFRLLALCDIPVYAPVTRQIPLRVEKRNTACFHNNLVTIVVQVGVFPSMSCGVCPRILSTCGLQ